MNNDYNRSPQEVLEELGSCPTGLTEQQAAERLAKYGPNKLQEAEKPTLLQRFLTQLKDPMLLILLAAATRPLLKTASWCPATWCCWRPATPCPPTGGCWRAPP